MPAIALVGGDGVGPEVMGEARKLLETVNKGYDLSFEITEFDLGADHYLTTGLALPEGLVEELRGGYRAILLGPLGDPRVPDSDYVMDIYNGLARELDLYVTVRPVKLLSADLCPLLNKTENDVDFVFLWQGLGLSSGLLGVSLDRGTEDEIAIDQQVSTRRRVQRILQFAFEFAGKFRRSKVTLAQKPSGSGPNRDLWLRTFQELRRDFPDISCAYIHVDTLTQQLVTTPENFDVIVTNSTYGPLLSSMGVAFQGGHGMAHSALLHPGKIGLFRPLHTSSIKYAGKDYANPIASLLCVKEMVQLLGHVRVGAAIEAAIRKALASGWVTRDLGGSMGTSEVGDYICSAVMELAS